MNADGSSPNVVRGNPPGTNQARDEEPETSSNQTPVCPTITEAPASSSNAITVDPPSAVIADAPNHVDTQDFPDVQIAEEITGADMFARAFVGPIPFPIPPQEEQQSGVESRDRTTWDTPITVQDVGPRGIMGYGQAMAMVRKENRRRLAGNRGTDDPPSRDPPSAATRPRSPSRHSITYDISAVRPSSLNPSFVAEHPGPV